MRLRINVRRTVAVAVVLLLILSLFSAFGLGSVSAGYSIIENGNAVLVDGVRYPTAFRDRGDAAGAFGLHALAVGDAPDIIINVYETVPGSSSQIYVDLWMANIVTASGAVGLTYDDTIVKPSDIDSNAEISTNDEYSYIAEIMHNEIGETGIYLDDIFYFSNEAPDYDSSDYNLLRLEEDYVVLEYWPRRFTNTDFENWDALSETGFSNGAQLIVTDVNVPGGYVVSRLSFSLQPGQTLTYSTFNFHPLFQKAGAELEYSVYIQSGAWSPGDREFFFEKDASIITFTGLPNPPEPYEPWAVNNGDGTLTLHVPAVGYVEDEPIDLQQVPQSMLFNVYLDDSESSIQVPVTYVGDYKYGIVNDGYTMTGATFVIDADGSGILALLDIVENGGTLDLSSLYLGNESLGATPVTIPRCITLYGEIISYAPQHEATISLYPADGDGYSAVAAFQTTVRRADGTGQWSQSFSLRSSELAGTYKLVIEKPSHVPYVQDGLVVEDVNQQNADDPYFVQTLLAAVTLSCGDINADGLIKQNDRSYLLEFLNDPSKWGGGGSNPSNPADLAYLCDLDGDGKITLTDLNILMVGLLGGGE